MKHTYFNQIKSGLKTRKIPLALSILAGNSLIFFLLFFNACDPTQMEKSDFGSVPSKDQIAIQVAPGKDDFRMTITAKSPVSGIAKWDFGNGVLASGSANIGDTAYYPLPGTYKVKLTLYTRAGVVTDSTTVTTTKTDYSLFNTPVYSNLTGGITATNGKTWVLDSLHSGHLGVSAASDLVPVWWSAGVKEKVGKGIYDDKLTFTLEGFKLTYDNHGNTYANKDVYQQLGGTPVQESNGNDFIVQYTPATNLTWSIVAKNGKNYIVFPNGGFVMYYTGSPFEYEILSMNADVIFLRQNVGWGAWFFRLIREGYTY